ncbi:hypothetical protein KQI63_09985 [bacterium]|nr:hypothetical protein [bacterium]
MPTSWTARTILLVSIAALLAILAGCANDNELISDVPGAGTEQLNGCIGCHTDEAMLQATADPVDEPPPSSGEG